MTDTTASAGARARRIGGAVASLLPVAGLLAAGAALMPSLGARMAIHWSGDSAPNGFASTSVSFWVTAAIAAGLAVVGIVAIATFRRGHVARITAGLTTMVAAFLGAAWAASALATASAERVSDARLGWGMLLLIVGPVLGALVLWLVPSTPYPAEHPLSVEPVPLRPGERLAWTGVTGNRLFVVIGALVAVLGVGEGVAGAIAGEEALWVAAAVCIVLGLLSTSLASARLFVDERGIRLVTTMFRIPLVRIRATDITGVSAETIEPMQWGGWGLRFSGRGRAYVTRRGEGIVVTTRNGGATAITLPRAAEAAAVVQAVSDAQRR